MESKLEINLENIKKEFELHFAELARPGNEHFLMKSDHRLAKQKLADWYPGNMLIHLGRWKKKAVSNPEWSAKYVRKIIAAYQHYVDEPRYFTAKPLDIEDCYLEFRLVRKFFPVELTAGLAEPMETLEKIIRQTSAIRAGYYSGKVRNIDHSEIIYVVT